MHKVNLKIYHLFYISINLSNSSELFVGSFWVVAPDLKGFGDSEKPFLASQYSDETITQVK